MSIYGTVSGRVGFDAEVRRTPRGRQFLVFKVASNKKVQGTEDQWLTTWVKCEWWGGEGIDLGAWAGGIVKGRRIKVEGFLELEEWQDRASGNTRQGLKLVVREAPVVEEEAPYQPRNNGTQARGASNASRGAAWDRDQPRRRQSQRDADPDPGNGAETGGMGSDYGTGNDDIPF